MNISLTFRLSKKDLLFYLVESALVRWHRLLLLAFVLFASLTLFQLALNGNSFHRIEWAYVLLPIFFSFVIAALFVPFNFFVLNRKLVTRLIELDSIYTFRDSDVEIRNSFSEGVVKYDAWTKHVITHHHILLYQDLYRANIVPLRVMTDEQRKELCDFLKHKKWNQDTK